MQFASDDRTICVISSYIIRQITRWFASNHFIINKCWMAGKCHFKHQRH